MADNRVIARTRSWLEHAVIGLNLCPFAKAVHVKGQVHYAVSAAHDWNGVLADLERELVELATMPAAERDTTLLMVTQALDDFVEFNGFLAQAERLLATLGFDGVLQLASFHPRYQFAQAEPQDAANNTNRAPYPTLHLLREESIARAVQAFPEAEAIYEANIATMRRLGHEGWKALEGRL